MGSIMQYVRVRARELERLRRLLVRDPDGAYDYVDELADGDGAVTSFSRSRSIDTDKAWDALAFLLHRAGPPPVDVVAGGELLTEDEWGTGPPRFLSATDVARAAGFLTATPFDRLREQFEPAGMTDVYPGGYWTGGADQLEYLRAWYERLVEFYQDAADQQDAMIVYLA